MTKQITVGKVKIGGGAPVSIQSMLNTRTTDVEGSLAQLDALAALPYTILFLDGNHECFPEIFAYPEEMWNGGRIHRIRRRGLCFRCVCGAVVVAVQEQGKTVKK